MKTWIWELAVVWLVLIGVVAATRGGPLEAVGALAVLCTFAHAQVAERMREKEALKSKPDVHCHRWSLRYFFAKELLWLAYFVAHRSWSALVGVGVFLLYPLWRKWWRARRRLPVDVVWPSTVVYINGRRFPLAPGSVVRNFEGWTASLVMYLDRSGCEFIAALSRARESFDVCIDRGPNLMAGRAAPARLQFSDRPGLRLEPLQRVAGFQIRGEGELRDA